jgi:hypothetical protein
MRGAREFRERAATLRRLATTARDGWTQDQLLLLARRYEALAAQREGAGRGSGDGRGDGRGDGSARPARGRRPADGQDR